MLNLPPRPLISRILPLAAALFLPLLPLHADDYDLPALTKVEQKLQALAEKTAPSVVALTHAQNRGIASGSGVIIARNGLLLTAGHVVGAAQILDVTFPDGKKFHAKVLGADYDNDVAVAMITEPGTYPFTEMGAARELAPGELVMASGHPGGMDLKRRVPLRMGRVFDYQKGKNIVSDCTLISGDSGGPLFDLQGKVIGIHSSVGASMWINNDIPIDAVINGWDRMLKGDRWGKVKGQHIEPKFAKEEFSGPEWAGLDVSKFRKQLIEEGMKQGGQLKADSAYLTKALADCGMQKEKIAALKPDELVRVVSKAMGGSGMVAPTVDGTAPEGVDLAGMDLKKFRQKVIGEAMKNQGQLHAEPDELAKWLVECGMDEAHAKSLKPQDISQLVSRLMNPAGIGPGAVPKAIADQDKEVMDAIRPLLEKVRPSVVMLQSGGKTLAQGTVVREDGFILTKHSDIAAAKTPLQVRLADGKTLLAVEVQQFDEDDLALVKVTSDTPLPVLAFPDDGKPLKPGAILLSPGTIADQSLLGYGVVSVSERSLVESGAYLGVGLTEDDTAVKIGEVMPDSPASRAGLKAGDKILTFEGAKVTKALELTERIRGLKPDAQVTVKYRRGEEEKEATIKLADRAKQPVRQMKGNPILELGTKVSGRRSGYPLVFQHDQPLKPEECGSVILDLRGQVVGLNVARVDRVETYAIPAKKLPSC